MQKLAALIADLAEECAVKIAAALDPVIHRVNQLHDRLDALPAPKDGKDGDPGPKGDPGPAPDMDAIEKLIDARVAERVAAIPKAKDGESVHPDTIALMVREAADKLVANLPRPKDGKDGRDGFGLEDFTAAMSDDGRILTLRFTRGDLVIERQLSIAAMLYRGIYRDDAEYQRGDTVTWAGSLWHRSGEGTGQPGHEGSGWTLCVKRGRDGKDAK